MKRLISVVLSAIILLGLFVGCKQEPEKKNITINIKTSVISMNEVLDPSVRDSYSFLKKASEDFCKQYKDANVKVNLSQFENTEADNAIAGCFNTDSATDVIYSEYINISDYIYSGNIVPLDDILTDNIKNDIKEGFWRIAVVDGKTYMIPFLNIQNTLSYNKDMFRKAGLERFISNEDKIQSWTLDEWDVILETLREKLPKTSYPMMMYAANIDGDAHIMTLLHSRGCKFFDENRNIRIDTPEGIAALQWIKECSQKKYFPPNSESLTLLDNYKMFINGQLAIYVTNTARAPDYEKNGLDIGYVNFPSADGKGYSNHFITGFSVFDNGDEEKIKVSKDFIKYIYESKWLDYCAESMPASKSVSKKYDVKLNHIDKYIENSNTSVIIVNNNPNWHGVREAFCRNIQELLYGEKSAEQIAKNIDSECNAEIEKGRKKVSLHS